MVLQDRFRVSQRRACRLAGQNRNTQRRPMPVAAIEEQKLRRRIRELARRHVRWGRRLVYRRLRLEGWSVNHKRVQRIWREEGLQRPLPRRRKRSRPASGSRVLLRAQYPHHVWAIDFQFDQTMDGRMLKFLNVVDEFSRVCLAIRVGRRCRAVDVIDTIEELLRLYPPPTHLRMDNGPEFIAHALQEWCTGSGSGTAYIAPGSPWENPFVESFNSRFRDEFLNIELFVSVQEARRLAEQYRMEYNTNRPHSALQGRTPLEVLQQWRAAWLPTSSQRNWTSRGGHVSPLDLARGDDAYAVRVEQQQGQPLRGRLRLHPGVETLLPAWIFGLSRDQDLREIQLVYQVEQEIHLVVF